MQTSGGPNDTSWWDELIAGLSSKRMPSPPTQQAPALQPPTVDQGIWAESVEQAKVNALTVHDVGLIVFNESRSYSDRPDSNETIDATREKMAHSIINADQKCGPERQKMASTALPIEPSEKDLGNKAVLGAYQSSMSAAREAYLSGTDPTNGAVHLNQRTNADRSNLKFQHGTPEGVPLSTQSGPYNNSYGKGKVPVGAAWLNTYWGK